MRKILSTLLFLLVVSAVVIIVAKDFLIKGTIEIAVTSVTGFKTEIDSLKYDFPSTMHIKGLVIKNPAGFKEEVFTSLPEIYVSLVLPELLKGERIHLPEVRLHLQEVNLEKNQKGISNIQLLSSVGGKPAAGKPAEQAKPSEPQKAIPFLLDKLVLTIRNVTYSDLSGSLTSAAMPKKLSMDLNVQEQVFTAIGDPKALVNLILTKILNSATLGRIMDIDPKQLLGDNYTAVLRQTSAQLSQNVDALSAQLDSAAKSIKTEELATAAKEQAGSLFGKLKSAIPSSEKTTATT